MGTSNAADRTASTARDLLFGARAVADATTAAVILGLIGMVWLVPAALLLPAFSLYATGCAAVAAAFAWRNGATRRDHGVTAWDVSGACMLIGIAAGMFSEPDTVVQLFRLSAADH